MYMLDQKVSANSDGVCSSIFMYYCISVDLFYSVALLEAKLGFDGYLPFVSLNSYT